MGRKLGILGGMGPLASAEFLKTVYELCRAEREQAMPACILYSDPTFPDRTEALLAGTQEALLRRLIGALETLVKAGASEIVIICFTIHHLLPRVPLVLRERVLSLVDVALEEVARNASPHLMLCTTGARETHLFESHPKWRAAGRYVVFPGATDQDRVHETIYRLKAHGDVATLMPFLANLRKQYDVSALVAGCTELHLAAKFVRQQGVGRDGWILDPLMTVAERCIAYGESGSAKVEQHEDAA